MSDADTKIARTPHAEAYRMVTSPGDVVVLAPTTPMRATAAKHERGSGPEKTAPEPTRGIMLIARTGEPTDGLRWVPPPKRWPPSFIWAIQIAATVPG